MEEPESDGRSVRSLLKNRRVFAVLSVLAVTGTLITVTQVSDAATRRRPWQRPAAATACPTPAGPSASPGVNTQRDLGSQNNGQVRNWRDDGRSTEESERRRRGQNNCAPSSGAATTTAPAGTTTPSGPADPSTTPPANPGGGLQILGDSCRGSRLQPHTGFQDGNRCVDTQFGEVAEADRNPSLLITQAPQRVRVGQAFQLQVSTRNLKRDRFLAAGQGGYYLESAFLDQNGITRGHFHTACRMLANTNSAPDPEPVPAFFVATEDGNGGRQADTITIQVTGMPTRGTAQCASWAGDGSHRIPMMRRANQTPAFDTVRITVE